MVQSFIDKFGITNEGWWPSTPADVGIVLTKGEDWNKLEGAQTAKYRVGVGKLLHMMQWSHPKIMNATREVSRYMSSASERHMRTMLQVMKYCVGTATRGLTLKLHETWDGTKSHVFKIEGKSNLDYAKDKLRKSISGWSTFLCSAAISNQSKIMTIVALSEQKWNSLLPQCVHKTCSSRCE